jgi:hypothetical protein
MRTVEAIRYVIPLREGSSVPALVEADDLGLYVVKLRGAGQGPKALIAELIVGELARALGLAVPEIVLVELDAALAASEPHREIAEQLERSAGLNVGLDYLPGSITFDPAVEEPPSPELASNIVLFDAFVANIDRTPRNPNLLSWHKRLCPIDHGAALYFHHGWAPKNPLEGAEDPFSEVKHHVLLPWATRLDSAQAHLKATLSDAVIEEAVAAIPGSWLRPEDGFISENTHRAAYVAWLRARFNALPSLVKEAEHARQKLV